MPPPALPGVSEWFFAFWELSTDRRFPGGPIPLSSIRAFPVSAGEADTFARCIRDADAAYLAFANRPAEEKQPMKQLQPGMIRGKT